MIIEIKTNHRALMAICKCDYCGKEFNKYLSIIKQYKKNYCSLICRNNLFSQIYVGKNNPFYGKTHTAETREKIKKVLSKLNRFGENAANWRGGKSTIGGYITIYSENHPLRDKRNRIFQHRLVMEQFLGRYLKPEERIHHINGIKTDNRIENLMLFASESEHQKYHHGENINWVEN